MTKHSKRPRLFLHPGHASGNDTGLTIKSEKLLNKMLIGYYTFLASNIGVLKTRFVPVNSIGV